MYRTVKTAFRASKKTLDMLFKTNEICGQIWNDCVELSRYYYRLKGKNITKTELQKELKKKYPVHSQTIQAVSHKYIDACESTYELRKKGYHKARFPYKKKNHFNAKWVDKAFSLEGNRLTLSYGNNKDEDGKKIILSVKLSKVPNGTVKEVELVYDRGLKFCLSYDDGELEKENNHTNVVANDVGEIHTIAAVSENGESIIITGRHMRSIHRLRNKKLRELQKRMSRCQKGSKQWRKYNRAKQYMLSKSEVQLEDALHKTTKTFVEWCVKQQTKKIITGNIDGVQRNTKKKRNKKTNQKLSNWAFGKLYQMLEYKANAEGIQFEKVDESYTSQTCPVCGHRKKVRTRNYTCRCGYQKHRDIHGACNILTKHTLGRFGEHKSKEPTYLRPVAMQRSSRRLEPTLL